MAHLFRWFTSYKSLVIRSKAFFNTWPEGIYIYMNRCFFLCIFPHIIFHDSPVFNTKNPHVFCGLKHHGIPIRIPGPIFGASPQIFWARFKGQRRVCSDLDQKAPRPRRSSRGSRLGTEGGPWWWSQGQISGQRVFFGSKWGWGT